jgi:hypothetical protein
LRAHGRPNAINTSLPGLTRQSISLQKSLLQRVMDARIKSGHDECGCVLTNLYFKQRLSLRHAFAISPHAFLREVFF